jgi:hypothetical protein
MTLANRPPVIALDEVLAYRHPGVLRRYCKDYRASAAEAEEVFRETLKWLYLCYRAAVAGLDELVVTPEIEKIDGMWHTFLLFTRDHADFCERHFELFLHHAPSADEDEAPAPAAEVRGRLEQQFGLVYDVLGAETLRAWYDGGRYHA